MIVYLLSFIIVLLLGLVGFLSWKLYVFATIIAVFENDLSENVGALEDVSQSLEGIIQLRMFFDNNDIQRLVKDVMDNIKLAKLQVNKTIKNFTDRSKNKYYLIEEKVEIVDNGENQVVPVNTR